MHTSREAKINSFNEIHWEDFSGKRNGSVKAEIENHSQEYILGVDEQEFKSYVFEKYKLEPLSIDFDNEKFDKPNISTERVEETFIRGAHEIEVYFFKIQYQFSGSSELFHIRPQTFIQTSTPIIVNHDQGLVTLSLKILKKDPEEFKRTKESLRDRAFRNLGHANEFAKIFNNELLTFIDFHFNNLKKRYKEENDFFAAINLKVDKESSALFSVPVIRKKIIPQPTVNKNTELAAQPTISKQTYEDILKLIYDSGKSMERKPSLYLGKDEEALRDQFLFLLESRYEGTTATGETFNKGGKTDIVLKYAEDSSNLFIAECKVWHGASEFQKAISQLFDNYLTWRDSKTALILFVRNKDFSSVVDAIPLETKNHSCYVSENGKRGESSFSYIFRLPQDSSKQVFLEIILFHFIDIN